MTPSDIISNFLPGRPGDDLTADHFADVRERLVRHLQHYRPTAALVEQIHKETGGKRPAAILRFVDRLTYSAMGRHVAAQLKTADTVLWPKSFRAAPY